MQSHLVSIITPAYCCADVVGLTINSVLNQTYTNWEMLIVEDFSPDNTREVLRELVKLDSRLRLIEQPYNQGPASARNVGLKLARGRWIAFLDSDDLWLPQKLQRCLEFAEEKKSVFVFTGYRRISYKKSRIGRYINVPKTINYRQLLGNTVIATSTVMIDRQGVGNIRMRITYYDDFDCWLNILKNGFIAHGLNKDLMRYRLMKSSVSRNKSRSASKVWRAYRDLEKLSLIASAWYFLNYSFNALIKYSRK
jgi:teichuronic acid biosynthesis glycosyltransferase TuaG